MLLYIKFETLSFISKIYAGLSLFSILWFTYSYNIYLKCNPNKLKNINNSKFDFCKRLDYENVSLLYSILGSVIYCPIRIFTLSCATFFVLLVLLILKLIGIIFPWVRELLLYNNAHILVVKFVGVFTLRLLGITNVNHYIFEKVKCDDNRQVKYSCVNSDCPPKGDDIITIVSNHISILDISFFMRYVSCGFVAQKEIRENYILGTVADIIGCIYVDRSCMETRSKARHLIQDKQIRRLNLVNSGCAPINTSVNVYGTRNLNIQIKSSRHFDSPEKTPLVIFPEGTTTNGSDIIPFKLGAFETLTPITPVVLSYTYSAYSPAFDIIPFWVLICLLLCNYGEITLSAYWLPQMHASPSETNDEPTKDFADQVRELMSRVLRKDRECIEESKRQLYNKRGVIRKREGGFDIFIDEHRKNGCSTTGSLRLKQEYIRMLL
ncbi:hypothetical protein OJ253_2625 [Cryptosporidium canis]|uniref:Phospholipid/glycerol acyltransferase domain-containing protein n=1 Tax=Cryptosporidium canis TaxID=195482 RepID=A0A9D5DJ10_9CRYT|nr:hypothetical protein OJ253_2625 [Cryptosporidium canis]